MAKLIVPFYSMEKKVFTPTPYLKGIILVLFILSWSCKGQTDEILGNALENQTNEQISQVVRTVFQDSKGHFWFGTENGAFQLIDTTLTHIEWIKSESGRGVTIKDIADDGNGTLWLGHTDGISSIKGGIVTNYYESDGLISNDVWCLTTDSKGKVWIGTIEGVCVFDGKNFNKFPLPEGEIDTTRGVSSTRMVHSIMEDSMGTIWFSSNAGLFSYAAGKLTDVTRQFGMQTNFVNEVVEGRDGKLWISTKVGLYCLEGNTIVNVTEQKLHVGKGIGSMAEDSNGNLWFVANQHELYSYNGKEITEFIESEPDQGPVVFQIYKDQAERLWFVGFGGAYRLENGGFINVTKKGPW